MLVLLPLLIGATDPACQVQVARQLYGVEIVTEGQEWDEVSLNAVLDALSRLPPDVVRQVDGPLDGPLYILCNTSARSLSGTHVYPNGANFFSTNDGRSEIVLYPHQGTLTVLHELGHAYQLRLVPAGRYAARSSKTRRYGTSCRRPAGRSSARMRRWPLPSIRPSSASPTTGPEVWQLLSNPDPLEDYANSFALFFYDPERLRQLSPGTTMTGCC